MSIKSTCNMLVKKVFDSRKPLSVEAEVIEQNQNMHDAFTKRMIASDPLKDGVQSKTVVDMLRGFGKTINTNMLKVKYDYLVEQGKASLKEDVMDLKNNHQTSATQAYEQIKKDMTYTEVNEKGKKIKTILDHKGTMDISMFISTSNNIAMYNHMRDGVRDYDGIYYENDFVDLLNDPNVNKEQRDRLKSMYDEHFKQVVEFETERRTLMTGEELGARDIKAVNNKAKKDATNFAYIEGFLIEHNQMLQAKVESDPRLMEVYNNIMDSRRKLTETSSEAMRRANRNIDSMFIFKPEDYYRAVFKDLAKAGHRGKTDIFTIDLSSTRRKGTSKSPYQNFFVSELAYRTMLTRETAVANFVGDIYSNPNYDKTKELQETTIKAIDNKMLDFSDKFDNQELTEQEQILVLTYIKKFNKLIGSRYGDLSIEVPSNIYDSVSFLDKEGNVFNQLREYIDVAVENEQNIIIQKFKNGDYDSMIEKYPQFKYLKEFYQEGKGQVTDRDLLGFQQFFSKNEDKQFNAVKLSNFKDLQRGLRNTALTISGFDFKQDVLVNNIYDENGNRRVIVNDLGTRLRTFSTNVSRNLDEISSDARLTEESDLQMRKEYNERYQDEIERLIKESLDVQGKDFERTELHEDERKKFDNEASLLATDYVQHKYLEPGYFKSLFYSDSKNATALTKQEIQRIFLSDNSTKRDYDEIDTKIRTSNSLLQDLLDGSIRFLDADVAKAISDVQYDMLNQEHTSDSKAMQNAKKLTRASKFGLLYSPFRVLKFNMNNSIGDTTMTAYNRPLVALKSLNPKVMLDYLQKYYQFAGKQFNVDEQWFLDNSQSFQRLNYNEILGTLDDQSKRSLKQMENELNDKDFQGLSTAKAMIKMKKLFDKYTVGVTGLSEFREMYLRTLMFEQIFNEIQTDGTVKNYGTVNRDSVEGIINEANEAEGERKLKLQRQASLVFANQALIRYDDLSKFSDNMATFGMPFIRFAEGNIRNHFRMFNNFLKEYRDGIKEQNIGKLGRTTARVAGNTALMMSAPIAIWNAINMALAGVDDEDIPEYAKENGYFMVGNAFISNTDIFSDFAENLGLRNLRYNLGKQIEDKGVLNGIMSGIYESFTGTGGIVNRISNYASPLLKSPFELITGQDLYPDGISYVGNKYTFNENVIRKSFQVLGLERFYEFADFGADPNAKMYKSIPEWFGFKISGDDMNEYMLARSNAQAWGEEVLGKQRKSPTGYAEDPKQALRYNLYKAIQNQDDEFAIKLFNEYVGFMQDETESGKEFGDEMNALKQSLKGYFDVIPSSSIPQKEYENYINSLSEKEIERLQSAYMNQEELLGPYYEFIYG